jgi:hypothetical protein
MIHAVNELPIIYNLCKQAHKIKYQIKFYLNLKNNSINNLIITIRALNYRMIFFHK